jgi:hypothetical protein
VADISPVRAFVGLQGLGCAHGSGGGKLSDLSPLEGMSLTILICSSNQFSDLSPLRGMPLETLECNSCTKLVDLSPIAGLPLRKLDIKGTKVTDLSPLAGVHLRDLRCSGLVSDLSPLVHCTFLTYLDARGIESAFALVPQLQKALPNCKIEWDDPAKPKTPEPAASGIK